MSDVVTEESDKDDLNEVRSNSPSPKRFRFSIRLLLLTTLVAAVGISWGSSRIKEVQREKEIVEQLQADGIKIEPILKPPSIPEKVLGKRFSKRSWMVRLKHSEVDALVALSDLDNVEQIESSYAHENLFAFSRFENLKSLDLMSGYALTTLAGIEHLQNLEELRIFDADSLKSASPLAKLKSLESLALDFDDDSKLEDLDKVIPQMSNLRSFSTNVWNTTNLNCFENLEHFEELDLELDATGITSLDGMGPSLKKLNLYYCDEIEDWSALDSMTSMNELALYGAKFRSLEFLRKMKQLKKLSVNRTDFGLDPKPILSLTQLERLSINCADLFALDSLVDLSGLKELVIDGSITSLVDRRFGELKSLESLKIYGAVELKSLEGIDSMQGLKQIHISRARELTDIQALSKLKLLEDVSISQCKNVSTKQIQTLQTLMPKVNFRVW